MTTNNLKKTLETEGIKQVELANSTGLSSGTINKICSLKYDPSTTIKNRLIKGIENLTRKDFNLSEIFPTQINYEAQMFRYFFKQRRVPKSNKNRDKELLQRLLSTFAQGSVSLQLGRYTTEEQIEKIREKVMKHRYA